MGRAAKLKKERKLQKIIKENTETIEEIEEYKKDLEQLYEYRRKGEFPGGYNSLEELEAYILDHEHIIEILTILKDNYLSTKNAFEYAEKDFRQSRENYADEYRLIHKYMM